MTDALAPVDSFHDDLIEFVNKYQLQNSEKAIPLMMVATQYAIFDRVTKEGFIGLCNDTYDKLLEENK